MIPAKYLFVIFTVVTGAGVGTFLFLSGWFGNQASKTAQTTIVPTPTVVLGVQDTQPVNLNIQTPTTQTPNPNVPTLLKFDENKKYLATLKTSEGDITMELNTKTVPFTVSNFIFLAQKHFYDGTLFHRVIKDFMIQGGDPKGDGTGDPGYKFKDEPFQGEYTRGTVAMANSGPNTNGSQFFIMQKDKPLPKNYVIFGQVVSGIEFVDKIAESTVTAAASGENYKPVSPVSIKGIDLSEK